MVNREGPIALEPECASEKLARSLLEAVWDCQLVRVPPRSTPTVDYRASDPARGVEVKRITSAEYHDLTAAANVREWKSSQLTGRWMVAIDRPTLSDTLPPTPHFADDDEDDIAFWERAGYTVNRRAEREEQWRKTHSGKPQRTVVLKNMGPNLEPHLAVLELHHIDCTRGADSSDPLVGSPS